MGKRLFLFVLEFFLLALPLVWLWERWLVVFYVRFFTWMTNPLFASLALGDNTPGRAQDRFVSFVPFVALMLVTPALGRRRRIGGLLLGVALVFLSHVVLIVMRSQARGIETFFPALLLINALPFALWAILAREFVSEMAGGGLFGRE